MAIKIDDFNAVARLADAELADGMGDHDTPQWRAEYCRYRQRLEQQWPTLLTEYRVWVESAQTPADKAENLTSESPTGLVIYGLTGSTRWFVRGNGEIQFSVRHCPPDCDLGRRKIATAQALGFTLAS